MPIFESPELIIIVINSIILSFMFFIILPKFASNNIKVIALNDGLATTTALLIAASLFMGKGITFNVIITQLNWFWFSLLSYFLLEAPFMWRYLKRIN